jgi:hypothetical protein
MAYTTNLYFTDDAKRDLDALQAHWNERSMASTVARALREAAERNLRPLGGA